MKSFLVTDLWRNRFGSKDMVMIVTKESEMMKWLCTVIMIPNPIVDVINVIRLREVWPNKILRENCFMQKAVEF